MTFIQRINQLKSLGFIGFTETYTPSIGLMYHKYHKTYIAVYPDARRIKIFEYVIPKLIIEAKTVDIEDFILSLKNRKMHL